MPPDTFWDEVTYSGIGSYYLARPPIGLTEGSTSELPLGDLNAFNAVVRRIRAAIDVTSSSIL